MLQAWWNVVCANVYSSSGFVVAEIWKAACFLPGRYLTVLLCYVIVALLSSCCENMDSAFSIFFKNSTSLNDFSFREVGRLESSIDNFIYLRTFLMLVPILNINYFYAILILPCCVFSISGRKICVNIFCYLINYQVSTFILSSLEFSLTSILTGSFTWSIIFNFTHMYISTNT